MAEIACAWCGARSDLKGGAVAPDGWLVAGPAGDIEEPPREAAYLCGPDHLMRWASVRIQNPSVRLRAVRP